MTTKPQDEPTPGEPQHRKPGAPAGNQNARKHGAYASDLVDGKRAARKARDKHRAKAQREVREILKAYGLDHDPLGKMVGRQVGRLEAIVYRLESHHSARGYFTREGDIKASVNQEIATVGKLLDEARRLLEKLGDLRPKGDGGYVRHVAVFSDGREIEVTSPGTEYVAERADPSTVDQGGENPAVSMRQTEDPLVRTQEPVGEGSAVTTSAADPPEPPPAPGPSLVTEAEEEVKRPTIPEDSPGWISF